MGIHTYIDEDVEGFMRIRWLKHLDAEVQHPKHEFSSRFHQEIIWGPTVKQGAKLPKQWRFEPQTPQVDLRYQTPMETGWDFIVMPSTTDGISIPPGKRLQCAIEAMERLESWWIFP